MNNRIRIDSTQRGIRRLQRVLSDPNERVAIARAGAEPLIKGLDALTPVGSRDQKRYSKRKIRGKRNKPSVVTHTTRAGNLKASQTVVPTSQGVDVGPRMSPGGGAYAVYAAAVHSRDPYLRKAARRAEATGQQIMAQRLYRLLQRLDL